MKSISSLKEHGSIHLIVVVGGALLLIGTLGFLLWNNILQPDIAPNSSINANGDKDTKALTEEETEECLKELDANNPHTGRWSDHRDESECYPNIVSYDSLSDAEKETGKRNMQIESEANKDKDPGKCDQIQGNLYLTYPANLTKMMTLGEEEAKEHCRNIATA